jgi:NADH-quinone oxidoreductase subunit N
MYTKEASDEVQAVPFVYYAVAVVAILLNIIMGLYPSFVTNLLR